MIEKECGVSCRLLKKMARETFKYHTKGLPRWLKKILVSWFKGLEKKLC
jgi:hypothetical protein